MKDTQPRNYLLRIFGVLTLFIGGIIGAYQVINNLMGQFRLGMTTGDFSGFTWNVIALAIGIAIVKLIQIIARS